MWDLYVSSGLTELYHLVTELQQWRRWCESAWWQNDMFSDPCPTPFPCFSSFSFGLFCPRVSPMMLEKQVYSSSFGNSICFTAAQLQYTARDEPFILTINSPPLQVMTKKHWYCCTFHSDLQQSHERRKCIPWRRRPPFDLYIWSHRDEQQGSHFSHWETYWSHDSSPTHIWLTPLIHTQQAAFFIEKIPDPMLWSCVLLPPVLLSRILLFFKSFGLVLKAVLGSSPLFLCFSLPFSLALLFSLSLCFFDFFLDLLLKDKELLSCGPFGTVCAEDALTLGAAAAVEAEKTGGGWPSLSDTAISWESQSRPLWLESLLTSDSTSKGRGRSSTGRGCEPDVTPPSDIDAATPDFAPPGSPLPLEELSLPFTGTVAALLARCEILGFLLTRGSIKSAAGRFWQETINKISGFS